METLGKRMKFSSTISGIGDQRIRVSVDCHYNASTKKAKINSVGMKLPKQHAFVPMEFDLLPKEDRKYILVAVRSFYKRSFGTSREYQREYKKKRKMLDKRAKIH